MRKLVWDSDTFALGIVITWWCERVFGWANEFVYIPEDSGE